MQRNISMTKPSSQEQNSIIGSNLPWTLLKKDMRVIKAFTVVSGQQC